MDLYPAIDLRAGRVVRLSQGESHRETRYHDDPVAQAELFVAAGARWVHVVDLDRAFGSGENLAAVRAIVKRIGERVRVQVGGGLRRAEAIAEVLELGVARVVLGTAVVTDPALVGAVVASAGPERIAVGLDTRAGKIAIRGWVDVTELDATEVCRRVLTEGVRTIIYTDVGRDGMLSGPDLAGAVALQELGASVIASGGVGTLADVRAVRAAGLAGVIVGRALYDGQFSLEDALTCA
ncbi:MAG: 1-(5-phosphoribosyl)-5-[(5-phosphoribosylamino)methylideneamino]imidazole-4-carboxamide isomerase [Gemmatimonadales bacterium]